MAEKPDTVPGLGFKDKDKAEETIKLLEGRDPDYQKLAVKGLIGRAKRVLTLTKDEEKLKNINSAIKHFEDWLKDFDFKGLAKENKPYLPLNALESLLPLKDKYKIKNELADKFYKAYQKNAKGEYKNLRTISSGDDKPTWDIVRNKELKKIWKNFEESQPDLWKDDLPTEEHMELILWAFSPDASKIKKNVSTFEEKLGSGKKSSNESSESEKEEKPKKKESKDKKTNENKKKASKRNSEGNSSSSEGSSSGSDEESPKKKSKK